MSEANKLPWSERVNMLSIHPDAATRDDVAKMAAQIQELRDLPIGTFEPNENATLNGKPYKGEPLVMIPESKWKTALERSAQ